MGQYLPIFVLAVLAIVFGLGSFWANKLLIRTKLTDAKVAPYESGIVPTREPADRFPVGFYLVAMLFIMFDIEIIFLYPYAVAHGTLGFYGFWAIMLFSLVFFLSFVYEVAKGGLDWGPLKRQRPLTPAVSPERTTATTVRRVGLEGRPLSEETAA
jgi:NADH-quinone oxidoreductase subunit A